MLVWHLIINCICKENNDGVSSSSSSKKREFFLAKWFPFDHKVSFIFLVWSIVKSSSVKSYKGLVNSKLQAWTNEQRSLISEDQISPELGSKSLPVATQVPVVKKGKKQLWTTGFLTIEWQIESCKFYNFGINHLFTVHRAPLSTSDLLTFKYETEDRHRHRCLSSKPGLFGQFFMQGWA